MSYLGNVQKVLQSGQRCNKAGFTLLEIIMVMVLVGIIAAVIGPFLGQVMGSFQEVRQMSERERQAGPALERFVRDVRAAESVEKENDHELILAMPDGEVTYRIEDSGNGYMLSIASNNGNSRVLARYISSDSSFEITDPDGNYELVVLDLKVKVNNGGLLEFSAAAVPRRG